MQIDVKVAKAGGHKVYQYTAIDDATRIRALRIYGRHNQDNAIEFVNELPRTATGKLQRYKLREGAAR